MPWTSSCSLDLTFNLCNPFLNPSFNPFQSFWTSRDTWLTCLSGATLTLINKVNSRGIRLRIRSHCVCGFSCSSSASSPSSTSSSSLLPYYNRTFPPVRVAVAAVRATMMFLLVFLVAMPALWLAPACFWFIEWFIPLGWLQLRAKWPGFPHLKQV